MRAKLRMVLGLLMIIMLSPVAISATIISQDENMKVVINTDKQSFNTGDRLLVYQHGFTEVGGRSDYGSGSLLPSKQEIAKGIVTKIIDPYHVEAQLDSHINPNFKKLIVQKLI